MNQAKRILQWTVGIVVGLYLAALLFFNLPSVQRWMASGVEALLEKKLETRVEVGRVELSWNGRILVDDVTVWDRQGEEMLHVARVGARLGIRALIHKRIRIGNAQLFGLHANLYQECESCDPNFKFLLDAFASKDTTSHTPLDLRIGQLLVRRGNIKWRQRWKCDTLATGRLNPSDLELTDLNLTSQLNTLTDDSLNVRVKRLDVCEKSGLCIKSLAFVLEGNKQEARLADFNLRLPSSSLTIPSLTIRDILPFRLEKLSYDGALRGYLSPADLAFLFPDATKIDNEANLDADFRGRGDNLSADFQLRDAKGLVFLSTSAMVQNLRQGSDGMRLMAEIDDAYLDTDLLRPYVKNDLVNRIHSARLSGNIAWASDEASLDVLLGTPLGTMSVVGKGNTDGHVDATVKSEGFDLGTLLDNKDLGHVALVLHAKGQVSKYPTLILNGRIPEIDFRGYRYRNLDVDGRMQGKRYEGKASIEDVNIALRANGLIDLADYTIKAQAHIANFSPYALNLTKRYAQTHFAGNVEVDLQGHPFDLAEGIVFLNDFAMADSTGTYRPGDIHITSKPNGDQRHILLISPFLEAQVEGNFEPNVLVGQVRQMLSQYLPTVKSEARPAPKDNAHGAFTIRAYNAEPLRRLLDIPLTLSSPLVAHGEIDTSASALWLTMKAPSLQYGSEDLHNLDVRLESNYESLLTNLQVQRLMKGQYVNLGMDTQGHDGKLTSRLFWNNDVAKHDNPETTTYAGDINLISRLFQTPNGGQGFEGEILPSSLIVSDTLWSVHPGFVSYSDNILQVDSFQISKGEHFVKVEGRASKLESDTLHAQLRGMNLEYIFSLINFHAVELTGEATGDVYAHSLFSSPKADAYIRIPQFALNYGTMGDLDIHLNWGRQPYSIYLNGDIVDAPHLGRTLVEGYITPKKDVDYHGIDLNVKSEHVNLYFIYKWTSGIFDNLQGRATGWVHIFGPFKTINLEGDALVDEASVGVPSIGVRYHVENDSIHMRPNHIYFAGAHLYDPQGHPGMMEHSAVANGSLRHQNFKNLSYDITIEGQNILGYDFRDFGDMSFYGTVYATGAITLKGHPGEVNIGIKAAPERGTSITYNASSPDKITDTPFITYRTRSSRTEPNDSSTQEAQPQEESRSDMHIDFDLDIDNRSTMNLLMDARSGDMITLNGRGHMLAHFYNKGAFSLFGTYRVERGTYNLSLQEVIHKNFEFSDGGTLVFNGEPYDADLNLQAVHTVSGVSLNDINPKANFSNTSARVNCLMNIGGKARAPRITFDFDILNANEDEKQMVRSLISTEEERNMQVVYLLGIGRFYAYDYANDNQNQGTTAMYSVLSSTLSGTINQALSNMMGTTNWNVGANLRTGEDGWNDMDVEGMLQGNLLNNRLLLNGNFGYRDNPMASSNFIGDFDVKYLLTRSGTVALKAYSETNDRYFTKSSLTTQGIGVVLKKDFTSWRDLMGRRKQRIKN